MPEREKFLLELVRGHVAQVLGHGGADEVPPDRAFNELGLTSLGAVELRNALNTETGLSLPPTLAFDYPTPWPSPSSCTTGCARRRPTGRPRCWPN